MKKVVKSAVKLMVHKLSPNPPQPIIAVGRDPILSTMMAISGPEWKGEFHQIILKFISMIVTELWVSNKREFVVKAVTRID